ncbi:spore germination protein [Bacillus sp. AK128]
MPSFVGGVQIHNVGDGAFTVGDAFRISPNGVSHDKGGAGAFNTGSFMNVSSKRSVTGVLDSDISDQMTTSLRPFLLNI